jgi:allophanate hydrolase subunit 1
MLLFGLGGFVTLVGEVNELHSGHVPGPRALIPPKTLGHGGE